MSSARRNGKTRTVALLLAMLRPQRGPRWGTIFITRKCNLRCRYCFVPLHGSSDITADEWERIADRLAAWGVRIVNIVGGEPTVRDDLDRIIAYMASRGIFVFLHTNCLLLNRDKVDTLVANGLFGITGSLDSLSSFEKSDPHVLEILEYSRQAGLVSIVSSVLTSANGHELPAIARAANERGIIFNFGLYQSVGGLFSIRDDRLQPPRELVHSVVAELAAHKRRTGGVKITHHFMDRSNIDKFPSGWKCNPLRDDWVVINNDGTLMRCQEYASPLRVLDTPSLKSEGWRRHKIGTVQSCPGCYHHCYFEAETVAPFRVMRELGSGVLKWRAYRRNR